MNDDAQDILKTQFESLPKDIQGAITSVDLRAELKAVADKHRLHLDQAGALENETVLVMLGLEHPRDYIRNLEREARVDAAMARGIAEDVNKEIFRPIRESLKKIHGIGEGSPEAKPAGATPEEPAPKPERRDFFKALREKELAMTAPVTLKREAAPAAPTPRVEMERAVTLPVRREETPEKAPGVPIAPEAPMTPEMKKEPIYPLSPVTAKERVSITLPKESVPTPPDNLPFKEPAAPLEESPFKRALAAGRETARASAPALEATHERIEAIAPVEAKKPIEAPMIYPRTMREGSARTDATPGAPQAPTMREAGERPARGIVEEKLSAPFRMPGEERKEDVLRGSRHPYEGGDPYREPVN